jgi:hypothetical protein
MILVEEDFRKFMTEFKTLFKSEDSDDEEFSDSNSNFMYNFYLIKEFASFCIPKRTRTSQRK